jgi:hypothetical protein
MFVLDESICQQGGEIFVIFELRPSKGGRFSAFQHGFLKRGRFLSGVLGEALSMLIFLRGGVL